MSPGDAAAAGCLALVVVVVAAAAASAVGRARQSGRSLWRLHGPAAAVSACAVVSGPEEPLARALRCCAAPGVAAKRRAILSEYSSMQ